MKTAPLRGRVWFARTQFGEKPFVVVSNNRRNEALPSVMAVRITTAPKPALPSIVQLRGQPVQGAALCDEIATLRRSDLVRDAGALSERAMRAIDAGLKAALGIA